MKGILAAWSIEPTETSTAPAARLRLAPSGGGYVQAAVVTGVSTPKILLGHILPNVAHIVIIALVMDFSGLVLAEAVLSYVGIGYTGRVHSTGLAFSADFGLMSGSVGGLLVPVLQPALVAAQLLFDLFGSGIESKVRIMRLAVALQDQAMIDVQHDIAIESARRCLAKGDVG